MCVDCVLDSLRIAQVDPGRWTPSPRWFCHTLDCRVKRFYKYVLSFEAPSTSHLEIFKLKFNNLIFNEIMVLNVHMCVCSILASSRII
jgi:hypothetical protein